MCLGQAASMGSLLLTAGAKGKRFALPNSRIMIHQPSGGAQGQAADIEIQAREILRTRERLNQIYVEHTGQKLKTIEAAMDRDNFMAPDEAKEFGLIDEVVEKRPVTQDENGGRGLIAGGGTHATGASCRRRAGRSRVERHPGSAGSPPQDCADCRSACFMG